MSAKGYLIIEQLLDFTKVLSQVLTPGFSYFGRFYLMPNNLGNVYIVLNHNLFKRSDIIFKLLSPPVLIFSF